jgi:DNA polymerase IV
MSIHTNQHNNPFDLEFNAKPSTVMHIDLNSCFAMIEQQANPKIRGKPVVVAAYASPGGCILASSPEAKRLGIKTGMRVKEGKVLWPGLIVLSPDPWKYRNIHLKLKKIFRQYTNEAVPKSIDEFVLEMEGYPGFKKGMASTAEEIKRRIKCEIGDWLTVSVGIGPNRFLAKTGAGLRKPDGLDEINQYNFEQVFKKLKLQDLCGIATRNEARLHSMGIYNVWDFYNAPVSSLRAAFHSVNGYYWYLRLRGWEIDDVPQGRKSYGNSYALPKPLTPLELAPILQKLVEKMSFRLRRAGYKATGIHLGLGYRTGTSMFNHTKESYWHKGVTLGREIFESRDVYQEAFKLLLKSPLDRPVTNVAISVFGLTQSNVSQLNLLEDVIKKENLSRAVDDVNNRWGSFVITPARMVDTRNLIPDRIAFGGVKELEEFTLEKTIIQG